MTASLYIHIPFCKKKCDYCDFFSIGERDRRGKANDLSDSYINALITEAHVYARRYNISEWRTIYVGGGTPSLLSPAQIIRLISGVKRSAHTSERTEITVEMNPDDVCAELLHAYEKSGVNRLSMGIQAIDDRALRAVNRGATVAMIQNALETLSVYWHGRLSVDFIAGLPNHTYASFKNQFDILKTYPGIDHVSLYTLTVEENTPLWKRIEDGNIAFSYEKADRMWLIGRNLLEQNGFLQYEVSNFAKPGAESRHNTTYWKQEDYIGVGAGATGTVYDFEKKSAERWTNTLSIPAYCAGVANAAHSDASGALAHVKRSVEFLDEATLEFEFLMLGFRRCQGVSAREFERRFGRPLAFRLGADKKDGVFSQWQKNRLATIKKTPDGDTIYSLNRRGILLLNRFLVELQS